MARGGALQGEQSPSHTPRARHPDPGMDARPPLHMGQAGDRSHQPSGAKWEGQPSPSQTGGCPAGIHGLQMSMCCPRVTRTTPSPGTKLPRGGPPLLPCSLPQHPRCDVRGRATTFIPSYSLNESSKVLKLHEKGRGWAGPGGHNAHGGGAVQQELSAPSSLMGSGLTPPSKSHSPHGAVAGERASH